jgi:hypothetical protein
MSFDFNTDVFMIKIKRKKVYQYVETLITMEISLISKEMN